MKKALFAILFVVPVLHCNQEPEDLARKAVNISYGTNDYLTKMLIKRLRNSGQQRKTPLFCRCCSQQRQNLRIELSQQIAETQEHSIRILQDTSPETLNLSERNRAVILWIMNSLLEEKLYEHEELENANNWKVINGTAAIVVPFFVVIIQFLIHRFA